MTDRQIAAIVMIVFFIFISLCGYAGYISQEASASHRQQVFSECLTKSKNNDTNISVETIQACKNASISVANGVNK